jgi:hypothetical protein
MIILYDLHLCICEFLVVNFVKTGLRSFSKYLMPFPEVLEPVFPAINRACLFPDSI